MKNYKTFYANSIEGCVSCGLDDLPKGGNWIVSDNEKDVISWLNESHQVSEFYKVSNEVLIAVESEFGIY